MRQFCFIIQSALFCLIFSNCKSSYHEELKVYSENYQNAQNYFKQNQFDSAYSLFAKVNSESNDTLELANSAIYMGIIQFNSGDYFGSQEVLLKALSYLNPDNSQHQRSLVSVYNELGRTLMNLQFYKQSIEYYDRGASLVTDEKQLSQILNNKAVTYSRARNYEKALEIYEKRILDTNSTPIEYARQLSNYHKTKYSIDSNYNPLQFYWEALHIRKEHDDLWGLNASYAHLSEYYLSKNKLDSANLYSTQMLETARTLNSAEDKIKALKNLIRTVGFRYNIHLVDEHLRLTDSIQNARVLANNQFTLIRYETEKAKSDYLQLQEENKENQAIILLMIIIIVLSGLGYYMYIKILQKNNQNKLNELKLTTSQKVHDVVANGLYELMSKVEFDYYKDKEILLDELEILYIQSRDLSNDQWRIERNIGKGVITEKINNFSTGDTNINIVGNIDQLEKKLSDKQLNEIVYVIRELLINMKKHSKAKNVLLKFEEVNNSLKIKYKDDGIGIVESVTIGSGIRNAENRIKSIEGQISFDGSTDGMLVNIIVPYKES